MLIWMLLPHSFFELCYLQGWSPAVPVFSCRVLQVHLGLWVGSRGWLGLPEDTRHASPGCSVFDFRLEGKTDTDACSEIIAHSSRFSVWV